MNPWPHYVNGNPSTTETCNGAFQIPYEEEEFDQSREHYLCVDQAELHINALRSAPTYQPVLQADQSNRPRSGDQQHMNNAPSVDSYATPVQTSPLCTITPTTYHAADTSTKSHNLGSYPSSQTCTDRNDHAVNYRSNLSSSNASVHGGMLSFSGLASSERSVSTKNTYLATINQAFPTASQQPPDPPPFPRNFRAKEDVYQSIIFVPMATEDLSDGYEWRKYGQKKIKDDEMNPRSYFNCAVPDCPIKKWTQSYSEMPGSVHFYYVGRHSHPPPPM
ncbi:hypothetical protein KP509_28G020900 [Ceratopteris richardii]|uniref:WRKY domain-containing protein n=1 Tax=Ceratopteris richardii TaxID=49495 RepID=A0A8T2RA91_CERRI|nr:hypothetical protein KP509_28G020900 [Ceratopteris richardii]